MTPQERVSLYFKMKRALRDSDTSSKLSHSAYRLLDLLMLAADELGDMRAVMALPQSRIAKWLDCTPRGTVKPRQRLERESLVLVTPGKRKSLDSSGKSAEYQLNVNFILDLGTQVPRSEADLGTTVPRSEADLGTQVPRSESDLGTQVPRSDELSRNLSSTYSTPSTQPPDPDAHAPARPREAGEKTAQDLRNLLTSRHRLDMHFVDTHKRLLKATKDYEDSGLDFGELLDEFQGAVDREQEEGEEIEFPVAFAVKIIQNKIKNANGKFDREAFLKVSNPEWRAIDISNHLYRAGVLETMSPQEVEEVVDVFFHRWPRQIMHREHMLTKVAENHRRLMVVVKEEQASG